MAELVEELSKLQSLKNYLVTVWTRDRGIATIPVSAPDATSVVFTVMALEDVNRDSILEVREET